LNEEEDGKDKKTQNKKKNRKYYGRDVMGRAESDDCKGEHGVLFVWFGRG
jgi:hypothetical protein